MLILHLLLSGVIQRRISWRKLFIELSGELEDKSRRRKYHLSRHEWWATSWGQMISDPRIRDITTREGLEFRRRFRVPAPYYSCGNKDTHMFKNVGKRYILEMSTVSKTAIWGMFRVLATNFSEKFSSIINMPLGENLEKVLAVYNMLERRISYWC